MECTAGGATLVVGLDVTLLQVSLRGVDISLLERIQETMVRASTVASVGFVEGLKVPHLV
jgi:hypothetical protein